MHKELEKYLSQIKKQLAALPIEQREEELREIRSQLEMMIEENVAQGDDADEAVAKALEQFGAANKIGRDLKHVPNNESKRKSALYVTTFAFITLMFLISPGLYILTMIRFHFTSHLANTITFCSLAIVTFIAGWTLEEFRSPAKKTALSFIKRYALACLFIMIWVVTEGRTNVISPQVIALVGAMLVGMWLRRWQIKTRAVASN